MREGIGKRKRERREGDGDGGGYDMVKLTEEPFALRAVGYCYFWVLRWWHFGGGGGGGGL